MRGIPLSWPLALVVAAGLVLAGAGGAYLWLPRPLGPIERAVSPGVPTPQVAGEPLADVVITLSDDAITRAGVVVMPVTVSETAGRIRLAGVVEPNGYRQVVVAPLVSGRVTRVPVMLGDQVAMNAPVVEIYSPELADAQTRFLSMRAEFQAVEQEIARSERLVEIGAASKQELERIHAEHVRHRTELESARARLQLLGMTPQSIDDMSSGGQVAATITIAAPIAGTVTARAVNPGTSVDSATPLITLVDLSTVWVVGDLYERDFSLVSVGSPAVVTTTAFPDARILGQVAYIDPQVRSDTRTAKVRVEVPNPGQRLRLGMYAQLQVATPGAKTQSIVVPRSAVRNVSDRTVVYVSDSQEPTRFIEREVHLGESSGDHVVVASGLQSDDRVVTAGSFSLRAERDRLGLRAGP
jgi:cobalt-zinc-cadmium efflux system membrane fusion protein